MHKDWQDFLAQYTSSTEEPPSQLENLLCNLSEFGLLKVSGIGAKKLLQGQLTCNVDKITTTHSCMGAHCNPQGRIISLFYLFLFNDAYYLLMPHSMIPLTIAALKKYAAFYKTELIDASDSLMLVGYSGEAAATHATTIKIAPHVERHIIIGEFADIKTFWEQFAKQSRIVTLQAWKNLNIHAGIPTIYPETSGKFLPHEINLQQMNAISFEKGCYTGQEIIARMHYRGKLKNHMYSVKIHSQSPFLPGTQIYSGEDKRPSGTVVDASQEEYNNYCALIVTDELNAKNNHLFLESGDKSFFTFS